MNYVSQAAYFKPHMEWWKTNDVDTPTLTTATYMADEENEGVRRTGTSQTVGLDTFSLFWSSKHVSDTR